MARVHIEHEFSKPVDRVFAFLSEHENLETILPAKIKRLKDGDDGTRNGVGSARQLRIAVLPPFEETTTEVVPNEKIAYKITKGSPLRGHRGVMTFSSTPSGGSRLDYMIEFGAVVPGLDKVVAKQLDKSIRAGLPEVDQRA
ncbi:SRPBCC family protein [Conexibacter sp. SYSU D00693]|uniref:SRPBCC family protein n=1 Tax=Conexibacter sp. SYSU D00693 TaxID=2812560 RepID=UPI00196B6CDF|nr:SRPBCC family protein [Conexibacter sp. SYSU D00693]